VVSQELDVKGLAQMPFTPDEESDGPAGGDGTDLAWTTGCPIASAEVVLDAMLSVAAWAEAEPALRRIVTVATTLVDARYGALGIVGPDRMLSHFVYVGIDPADEAAIGPLPKGRGLLGHLITNPKLLRLRRLADHPASLGFPPNHPPMRSFLGVPVTVKDQTYGSFYLSEKRDGSDFNDDDERILTGLAATVSVAVRQSQILEAGRGGVGRLGAVDDVAASLAGGNVDSALRILASRAMELVAADGVFIAQRLPGRDRVELAASVGLSDHQAAAIEAGAGDHPFTELLDAGTPWFTDPDTGPRWLTGVGPMVCVPLRSDAGVIGAIVAVRNPGRELFVMADLPLLKPIPDHASIAIEMAAKRRTQARLELLTEHFRVARNLCDVVVQELFAAGMGLQSVVERSDDPGVRLHLQHTVEQLDNVSREIRTSVLDEGDLAVTSLAGLGRQLRHAVADLCDGTRLRPSVRIGATVDTLVPAATGEHVKAAVREAVGNIVRRPGISALAVQVDARAQLVVAIEDDGECSPEFAAGGTVPSAGWLATLASRAEWCGGTCHVLPRPGSGSLIRWAVPLI
jgi:signal transduction histidine kinase